MDAGRALETFWKKMEACENMGHFGQNISEFDF